MVWDDPGGCEHAWGNTINCDSRHKKNAGGEKQLSNIGSQSSRAEPMGQFCQLCCAWRGNLGLEPTPELYISHIVQIFREVRRVLRDDGTLWLNLGDSYASSGGERTYGSSDNGTGRGPGTKRHDIPASGLKPKDLCGIPWRVALALQNDGWYLRSDIIWSKPNPMPESVNDRPTKSHEYLFLLAKNQRYYYDAEAIKESVSENTHNQISKIRIDEISKERAAGSNTTIGKGSTPKSIKPDGMVKQNDSFTNAVCLPVSSRNKRTVWTVATHPFPGAHFACVDEQTECLTMNGWKKYNEIEIGEMAAQFDMESGLCSWASIEDVAIYPVINQPLISATRRDLNLLLTPNHRTVVCRRGPRDRKWGQPIIVPAKNLKPSHGIPVSALWERETVEPVSEDFAELLGWYVTEGYEHPAFGNIEIYQSQAVNSPKVDRIRELLNKVGAAYKEASGKRQWCGRPADMTAFQVSGYVALKLKEIAPGKVLPWHVLNWSEALLQSLLVGMIAGDGHVRPDDGRKCLIQMPGQTLDVAQAIGTLLGKATKQTIREEGAACIYFTDKKYISLRGTNGVGAPIGVQNYSGVVWCPKLPKGTWVARRNGRVFFTGNTFPPKLIEPCILAGTSEKGCCPDCGKLWRRRVEKAGGRDWHNDKMKDKDIPGQILGDGGYKRGQSSTPLNDIQKSKTTGWTAGCTCGKEPVPCVVIDPFVGSGTTAIVSYRLNRKCVGIDLSETYLRNIVVPRIEKETAQKKLFGVN